MDEPIDFEDDDFGEVDFNQDVYNDEYWWTLLPQQ
jgi:hypothetical protein